MRNIAICFFRKKHILLTFLLLIFLSSSAQFFVGFNCGYAFPIYNKRTNNNFEGIYQINDNSNSNTEWVKNKFNAGTGVLFSCDVGYKFKKHIGLSLQFSYLNNNSIKINKEGATKEDYYSSFYEDSLQYIYSVIKTIQNYNSRILNFSPNFSYSYSNGKCFPEFSAGISISAITIFCNSNTNAYRHFETGTPQIILNDALLKYKYYKKFQISPYFSLSINYKINENLILKICSSYHRLIFKADSKQQYYSEIKSSESQSPVIDNTVYEKDLQNELFNLSSIDISLGIRYCFNKKK